MALAYFPSKVMFPLLVVVGAFYYRHHLSSSKALAITQCQASPDRVPEFVFGSSISVMVI